MLKYLSHFQKQILGNIYIYIYIFFVCVTRVVEPWNNLPHDVVCAESKDNFKKLIDSYSSNVANV